MDVFLIVIAALLVLLLSGFPISFALTFAGVAGLWLQRGFPGLEFLIASTPYKTTASFTLIVVPLFLFMGQMAFAAGISDRAFEVARKCLGHITGGLGMATVAACTAFAAVSGSSIATAATIAKVSVPQMLQAGYSQRLAAACAAAGGTLGVLIPPSGILVIYAIVTSSSLPKLFAAAILPGIITALAYLALVYFTVRADPEVRDATRLPKIPLRERLVALTQFWEVAVLFGVVMGGLFFGIVTATEAAALGAGLTLAFALMRGKRRGRIVWEGLVSTSVATSSIFLLLIGASLFGIALATTQVPQEIAEWLSAIALPRPVMILLLILPFLLLGCFIDGISMIMILMPILIPVLDSLAIDPILFGILVVKTTEIGAITPPVGLNVFVVKNVVPSINVQEAFRGVIPFIAVEVMLIVLFTMFPGLVLWPATII